MFKLLSFCAALFFIASQNVNARPVKIWQPADLLKEADVVVIATAKATTDIKDQKLDDAKADTCVAVETEFEVQAVLKGGWKQKSIFVRHHRYHGKESEITIIDGPCFVEFDPAKKHSYLIYLKLTDNGSFVPLTGQTDPVDSFLLQQPYHITRERAEKKE